MLLYAYAALAFVGLFVPLTVNGRRVTGLASRVAVAIAFPLVLVVFLTALVLLAVATIVLIPISIVAK